ncbi:MAG: AAA family ATPase [Anaerolineaceae bacterium]|nr:AAA family ATPase [Anaerolineaceae bacterium]
MEQYQNNFDDIQALINVLPEKIAGVINENGNLDRLLEVVMDVGRIPLARYTNGDLPLSADEITYEDIDSVTEKIGTFDLDNRAGMERTLHRISAIRNRRGRIIGLTCRVGRAVFGTLDIIADHISSGRSLLILGKPGIGKTTMLREAARVLSAGKRVVIVDTSNEIGGDGDVPHPAVGDARRLQVAQPTLQHEVMIEAVENHNPEVIIIDEIGRELEAQAARTIAERGVQLIGTAHGQTISNLLMNPTLSDLIGGIESVTLSDEEAKRRGTQKVVLERKSPPTFDVLVEIRQRNQVIVYQDVAEAVDALVRGIELQPELRTKNAKGQIIREKAPAPVLEGAGLSGGQNAGPDGKKGKKALSRMQSNILEISGKSMERAVSPAVPSAGRQEPGKEPEFHKETVHVYCHGVARNRLMEAAARLDVPVAVVNNLEEADIFMTLRPYYRERQRPVVEAEERGLPVYVLRSNTTTQIEYSLANMLKIEVQEPAVNWEDVEDETVSAIRSVLSGEASWADLPPADRSIRRIQQEMAEQVNLVCQPFGKEPKRRLRIYRG